MPKRSHGLGSITPLSDGRFWVRAPRQPDGSRPSLGYATTEEQAETLLEHGRARLRTDKRDGAPLWHDWISTVLDIRESDGVRGIRQDRSRVLHLKKLPNKAIDKFTPADVLEWIRRLKRTQADDRRGKRLLDHGTICRCVSLASAIFTEAVGTHIDANPCTGVPIKKDGRVDEDDEREEAWDWLRADEQEAFASCEEIEPENRDLVLFALGTGLRQGEQWHLRLGDVHTELDHPYVFVRVGSKGKRPKSGKTRRVALFGVALAAARRQIERLKGRTNPRGLLWPTKTGCVRPSGAPEKSVREKGQERSKVRKVELLPVWLRLAGIEREIRWHDLRHTFCSSLVSGAWGAPWTLEEVRDAAGHSSVTVTEKYAHLCETVQQKAVARMVGREGVEPSHVGLKGRCSAAELPPQIGSGLVGNGIGAAAILNENNVSGDSPDAVSRALKGQGVLELLRALQRENGAENPTVTHLAAALEAALAT